MVGGTALFYPMFCTFFAKVKCAKARALFAENKVRFARAEQLCRKLTLAFSSIRLFSVLSVAKRYILQQKCLNGGCIHCSLDPPQSSLSHVPAV